MTVFDDFTGLLKTEVLVSIQGNGFHIFELHAKHVKMARCQILVWKTLGYASHFSPLSVIKPYTTESNGPCHYPSSCPNRHTASILNNLSISFVENRDQWFWHAENANMLKMPTCTVGGCVHQQPVCVVPTCQGTNSRAHHWFTSAPPSAHLET